MLLAGGIFAADLTGKWTGTFTTDQGADSKASTAIINLKQDGVKLTGTAGPNEERLSELKGTVEGNKVRFEVQRPSGEPITFELRLDGDRMTGSAKGNDNGEQRHAKVDVTRSK